MDYEQIVYAMDSAPIFWREHSNDEPIELTNMCKYLADKLFLDKIYIMWPARAKPMPFFKIRVPEHFDPPYINEVVVPGVQKCIDAFDVKFVRRYIRFNIRGAKNAKAKHGSHKSTNSK